MKKALLLSVLSMAFVAPAMAEEKPAVPVERTTVNSGAPWGYVGAGAAHKWGDLAEGYASCSTGTSQSPINIDKFMESASETITPAYQAGPLVVVNTGNTVQVNLAGEGFSAGGKAYKLQYFEFHTPSEHYIDGAPYPMEVQFVHKADDGAMVIIAVMLKVGAHNPLIEGVWQNVPMAGSVKQVDGVEINAADLMPADKKFYSYEGSLTAPPCTEGVQWFVMQDPITLSAAQLKAFQAVFPVNARPIQDLNGRTVQGN